MYKTPLWLLTLLTCLYSVTLFAQTSVDVQISGINQTLETNVRLFLSIEQQKNHPLLSEGRLRRLHKIAPQEISRALQPFGYYRPTIKSELTQISPEHWLARYDIDPGPPLLIGEFDVTISDEMRKNSEFEALMQKLPLHKGSIFNHLAYENFKSSLARLASERGYFNAKFTEHRVEIDLDAYQARVYLHFDGGYRYLFGEVRLDQNVIDDELLRRYIPFEQGSPYSLEQMIDLQQALNDTDYFKSVEVSPDRADARGNEIPVNVALTPRLYNRYTLGMGYGTDSGARARFGWQVPLVNKRGHRFETEAKVSQLGYSLSATYRVPVFNPRTDQMVYSAGVVKETTDTSESLLRTIGASLKRSQGDWRQSFSLDYQKEDFIIADVSDDSTLLIPGISLSRIWGDSFIYAIDGLRFDSSLRGANNNWLSDTSFFQLQGGIKAIHSLTLDDRIITRGNLGRIWTNEFDQLPTSVRFFTGGAQTVRGYAYQSLGPVDANGKVIGGRYLMIGSIEYEHSFNKDWGAAVFYDGGNAANNVRDKLARGAGFGVRWKSPVGTVRVDIARALSLENKPWRLHVNIGPDL